MSFSQSTWYKKSRSRQLGPIIAGALIGSISDEIIPSEGWRLGKALCSLLLKRRVLDHEYWRWISMLNQPERNIGEKKLLAWMRSWLDTAYHQTFFMENQKITPEIFFKRCELDPRSALWFFAKDEVLQAIYSVKWTTKLATPKQKGP